MAKPGKKAPARKKSARVSRKSPAKAIKKIDKRGTPKGKGTIKTKGGGQIGNPPHKPTPDSRKLANDLASYGIPHWAIAEMMSISPDTLERHYAKEISLGPHRMTARAANMVAKGVLAGDKDYVKFYLARRGGPAWANKAQTEHSTPPGRPLETRDVSGFSDEELAVLAKLHDGD